jgi:hypothetical protein
MTNLVPNRIVLACMVAVIAMSAACDTNSPGARSGGLISSPSASLAVGIAPVSMPLIPMARASCPMTQPFTTTFDLFVSPSADEVVIDGMTLRFIDGSGASTRRFFSTKDLMLLFGNTTILSGTRRVFTLRPEFGCGLSTPRSVVVIVDLIDGRGGRHQTTATATFGAG